MNLFIGNVGLETTEDSLRTLFSEFGEVVSCKIPIDTATGMPRGFAFVEMADKYESFDAIDNIDQTYFEGQIITVKESKSKSGGGGGGNRRGGGGGYNRSGGGGYNRNGGSGGYNRSGGGGYDRGNSYDRGGSSYDRDRGSSYDRGGSRDNNRDDNRRFSPRPGGPRKRIERGNRNDGYNRNTEEDNFNKL